jgi:hypothetical protein
MLYLTNLDVNSLTIINNKVYTLSQIIIPCEQILNEFNTKKKLNFNM